MEGNKMNSQFDEAFGSEPEVVSVDPETGYTIQKTKSNGNGSGIKPQPQPTAKTPDRADELLKRIEAIEKHLEVIDGRDVDFILSDMVELAKDMDDAYGRLDTIATPEQFHKLDDLLRHQGVNAAFDECRNLFEQVNREKMIVQARLIGVKDILNKLTQKLKIYEEN
jgi:hypothetical protein